MNVIWIVADTFRRDHLGCYGNSRIRTPSLDALAARATRFDRHYIGGFPTMPTRADHHTGRWMMSAMGWGALPDGVTTIAEILADEGIHTAAVADTPFYWRNGMNYDRGFQTFFTVQGQGGSRGRFIPDVRDHEWKDVVAWWRRESDRNTPQTMIRAADWLERHYKEQFFLYVDTWDPHEPWDAPRYYTELYVPDYDGEIINPFYGRMRDEPGFTEAKLHKAHGAYCGEITMVDTWIGHLLQKVENTGIADRTAVVFTSDHGFYFGEHGGMFGKANMAKRPDGRLYRHGEVDAPWGFSPLYEEVAAIPLLIHVPGAAPGAYAGQTSAVDVMPTVLEIFGHTPPARTDGRSLLPAMRDPATPGRHFTVSSEPFANPGDAVRSVDDVERPLSASQVTTITASGWSLLYSADPGRSELYDLEADPGQNNNVIRRNMDRARELHGMLVRFMQDTNVAHHLLAPRLELRM